jgi:hypothetical protein
MSISRLKSVPADGIRLPFFLEAETSERRRFGAALSQGNCLTVREPTTFLAGPKDREKQADRQAASADRPAQWEN